MLTCHEAQKVFSERTIKLLSSIDAEFQQIEKYIACQKMLFFSRLFLVNCINPTLLHCHAVILTEQTKLYFPARHERRSTNEEERPMLPFFSAKNSQLTKDGLQKERQKCQEGIVSVLKLYRISLWCQVGQNWTVFSVQALGRVPRHRFQLRQSKWQNHM